MFMRRAGGGQIAVPGGGPAIARHLRCVSRGVIARQHGQSHNGFGAGSVGLAFHFMKEGYE